jgi:pyruvate dehydrogenase E2 component (dihydrolipoamide acetyltransferase)
MHEVIMPKLGLTMETGRIEKWHKKEGDRVEKGEVLFEVMTDKVTIEVESYDSGTLLKILHEEGEDIPVTEVVAYIGEQGEKVPETVVKKEAAKKNEELKLRDTMKSEDREKKTDKILGKEKGIKISPLARKIAEDMGIDYKSGEITGSGPGGRIVKEDVIDYGKSVKKEGKGKPVHEQGTIPVRSSSKLAGLKKVVAERMSYSKSTIPHLVLNIKADATRLVDLKKELEEKTIKKYGVKLTYTDFILKATAVALRENLQVNSTFSDGNYIIYDEVNMGVAVSIEEDLIVPCITNCDKLKIVDIAKKRVELVKKARGGKLSLEEVSNGTFTVTNLGMFGIRSFSPIINPPQAAILAVGEIFIEPAVLKGKIEPRSFMNLSVACDHRIINGVVGAKFLKRVVELIEDPDKLTVNQI